MNVTADYKGTTIRRTSDGLTAVRTFLVENIPGDPALRPMRALEAPGVPQQGQGHPAGRNMVAFDADVEMIENDTSTAVVTVNYGQYVPGDGGGTGGGGGARIRVGATVQMRRTHKDYRGKQLTVSYKYPADEDGDRRTETQGAEVEVPVAMPTVWFSQQEYGNPLSKAQAFVGKINASGVFGGKKHEWMVNRIEGESRDGTIFDVEYEFVYNDGSWDPTLVFIDPETGQPPGDVSGKNGLKTAQVIQAREFRHLRLRL